MYFDHLTSLDTSRFESLLAGSGTLTATDSCLEMVRTSSASDAAAFYDKTKVDKTKAQIYAFAFSRVTGSNGAFAWLINDASTPSPAAPGTWGPKARMSAGVSLISSTTGIFAQYFNTSHVAQTWNGATNAWSTSTHAQAPFIDDNFIEMFLETDPTLGARWGIVTNVLSGTTWGFDQGRHVTVLTDWVPWASMESTTDLWLVLGYPQTVSASVTARIEWVRYADGAREWLRANQKDAASGNYSVRSYYHYGDYYFVPRDRSTDDIAADARVPMSSRDLDGTLMMVYTSGTGTTGLKLATASSEEGPWTVQGTILTHPGTTNRNTISTACIYRDLTETDSAKIYKVWVSCVTTGPPYTYRLFLAYASTRNGPYTWYDDGSGADNSVLLGPGASGSYDEGGPAVGRISWDSDTQQWMLRYGGTSDGGALLQGKSSVAYSPDLVNGGTWTKYGSNPVLYGNDVKQDLTASLNGKTVTVGDTTGFVADAFAIFGQDTSTPDNWSIARIRKVTSSTQLELYSQLVGFTTTAPTRVRQMDSFPKNALAILRYNSTLGKWVAIVTSFQPFNKDTSPQLAGFCETSSLWTADGHLGPWTYYTDVGQPIPLTYFSGKRSIENYTMTEPALQRVLGAGSGSFTISGTSAALLLGRKVAADAGSFSLSGVNASLLYNRLLAAASGSFALTGTDATLTHGTASGFTLSADPGSFILSGSAAALLLGRLLAASSGAYSVTGIDAGLVKTSLIPASSGSFTLSGTDANLLFGRKLAADPGSFTLTGVAASFLRALRLSASPGSFNVTGVDASLRGPGAVLVADAGAFTLSGVAAALTAARRASADPGSFTILGTNASLLLQHLLEAGQGAIIVTGTDANLLKGRRLVADPGSFVLSGVAAALSHARTLNASAGAFSITGVTALLTWSGEQNVKIYVVGEYRPQIEVEGLYSPTIELTGSM